MEFELHKDLKRDGFLVGTFPLCLVLLINDRRYPWFVLVPKRPGLRELFELDDSDYVEFGRESKLFGSRILQSFEGTKLNVAALGNMTPQLHVHHVVRQESDFAWPKPIWGMGRLEPYADQEVEKIKSIIADCEMEGLTLT